MWATRAALVAKRSSFAHSGCPTTAASLAKRRSFPAATMMVPVLVSKPWNGTTRWLPVRWRSGTSPEARKLAKWPLSHASPVS